MLYSYRQAQHPELGVSIHNHLGLHTEFRIQLNRSAGVSFDELIFAPVLSLQESPVRNQLHLCLRGELLIRSGQRQHVVGPGSFLVEREGNPYSIRHEGETEALFLQWGPGLLGSRTMPPTGPAAVAPASLERLRVACRAWALLPPSGEGFNAIVAEIIGILRTEGFPVPPLKAIDLEEEIPEAYLPLSRAVDAALSTLGGKPMIVDIEGTTGRSASWLQRTLPRFQQHFSLNQMGGWRELLRRQRILNGVALMSAPRATTEVVARTLGYNSPTTFCHAFARAGLPSPGAIAERLRFLR